MKKNGNQRWRDLTVEFRKVIEGAYCEFFEGIGFIERYNVYV